MWDMTVVVGETAFTCNDAASTALTNSAADYTFTGSASGTVAITWTNSRNSARALYYRDITITYEVEAGTVTAPTMTPAAGWVMEGTTVALSAQEGAEIFYTTDDTEPTEASTLYNADSPIVVNADMTIKAIARLNNVNSPVKEAAYTVYPVNSADAPLTTDQAVALIDRNFNNDIEVYIKGTITDIESVSTEYGNANYTILTEGSTNSLYVFRGRYLDGENFTDANQIAVNDKVVVKGKIKKNNDTKEVDSNNSIVSIEKAPVTKCDTPVFSIASGSTVFSGDKVTISTPTEGAVIVYVINDGAAITSETNSVEVTITETCTIKARASKLGIDSSDEAIATYTVRQLGDGEFKYIFDFTGETPYDMPFKEYNTNPYTCTGENVTLTLNGSTRLWNATSGGNELRFYKGSYFTVAGSGSETLIKEVELIDAQNAKWQTKVPEETPATYAAVNGYENGIWTGSQNSVSFETTITGDNTAIKKISVIYEIPAAVETIEAESETPARYFNLQGVEVTEPADGIFIKVQGKKATKVAL